jgi:hypothetical protein
LTDYPTFRQMIERLVRAEGRSASARTVERFGWLLLIEGGTIFVAPGMISSLLRLPADGAPVVDYFRLLGLLISGLGLLYTVSGRVNAQGFIFASLIDRPIVPFIMLFLWYRNLIPTILAIVFSLQDFGSFFFTVLAWRAERKRAHGGRGPLHHAE